MHDPCAACAALRGMDHRELMLASGNRLRQPTFRHDCGSSLQFATNVRRARELGPMLHVNMGTRRTRCSLVRRIQEVRTEVRTASGNMLQDVVASVDDTDFEIEDALDKQLGSRPMPFPGMDSKPYRLP